MPSDAKHVRVQGERIPALGLGTWRLRGEVCVDAVSHALSLGYRHLDTAQAYGNEREVGRGVRESSVPRDHVWVTTKVWWENLTYEECLESARESLARLDLGWIDLLLIHWPDEDIPLDEPLSAMKKLRDGPDVRHIGVSNFTPGLLQKALDRAPILCNQVEYHPFLGQASVLEMAAENDLLVTAYSPLARGRVTDDETLRDIADGHGKTPAQVALRWLVQQPRVAAIPRAKSPAHRRENLDVFDFELTDEEMGRIAGLDEGLRLVDPAFAPEWEGAH